MDSKNLLRFLLVGVVAAAVGTVVTWNADHPAPRLIPVKPAKERKPMPGFAWTSTAGHKWNLEEQRGKIVFVNFWATWCGPCRSETPELVRVYNTYRGKGVTFAGISMDQDPMAAVPDFAEHF